MKKVLIVCGVVVLLVIGGVAIFVTTFDVDRYRPMVVSQLKTVLGRPVRLERLALGWHGGLAVELRRFVIDAETTGQGEPLASVERATATIRLLPLLKKQVQVASVIISHPRVHVARDAQGRINLVDLATPPVARPEGSTNPPSADAPGGGVAAMGSPVAASGQTASVGGSPVEFTVDALRVEDGELHWTDAMGVAPVELRVKQVDVSVKNFSLTRPVEFQIRLAVFSDEQNLRLSGRLELPTKNHAGALEAVRLESDLSRLKPAQIIQALPALRELGLQEGLAGQLVATVERLPLDPNRLDLLDGQLRLTKGRVALARVASPFEELTVEAVAKAGRVEVKRLFTKVAHGTITATAAAEHLTTQPHTTFQAQMDQLALVAFVPPVKPQDPQLRGRLSLTLQGAAEGVAWPQISRTLTGAGNLKLDDGVIANLNILRAVFEKLSVIPGLMQRLEARLPQGYQAKFAAKDTVLSPIDTSLKLEAGALRFDDLRIRTDTFQLLTIGRMGLDGAIALRAQLAIEPVLSGAIIKSVAELQALANQRGEMEIPLVIQGQAPRVAVLPDLNYVASKVVVTKAQDLLGNFLQKALEKSSSEKSPPPETTPPAR
ncbi:MAG: AsmA family protein [Candidatus Omnitrophica bacterium]|nr:AsmA family protein [Candidatus Omnitrophota bacterium]